MFVIRDNTFSLLIGFDFFDIFGLVYGKIKAGKHLVLRKLCLKSVGIVPGQYRIVKIYAEYVSALGFILGNKMQMSAHRI